MTEIRRDPAIHRSIFARLLAVMVLMSALLFIIVSVFYFLVVTPAVHRSFDKLVGAQMRSIADSRPNLEAARNYAEHLGLEIRYEAPDGGWTTDESVPNRAEFERGRLGSRARHVITMATSPGRFYLAETPDGIYIFAVTRGIDYGRVHDGLLIMLLVVMAGVFLTVYVVLKRALRPLRLLDAGARQLSEGNLDVVVEKQGEDEFGILTDAFNHMARRVREMVEARDKLLIDVSHELRSPLTRMKVALELSQDESRTQAMVEDVAEMETMVTELLELHRMDGVAELRVEHVDLVSLVSEAVDRYSEWSPGVTVVTAPVSLVVMVDPERVSMVLRNLIENALKFSLPDSSPVEVMVADNGKDAVVRLKDDGCGVPAGDVERLFEPFYRPDPSRSKKTGGFGLGLSICRRIMQAHGGRIALERNGSRGVTLSVLFPLPRA